MTKYIKLLDVCINRPFKSSLPHWDVDFRIKNQNSRKPNTMEIQFMTKISILIYTF